MNLCSLSNFAFEEAFVRSFLILAFVAFGRRSFTYLGSYYLNRMPSGLQGTPCGLLTWPALPPYTMLERFIE